MRSLLTRGGIFAAVAVVVGLVALKVVGLILSKAIFWGVVIAAVGGGGYYLAKKVGAL